jgi:hypothetical protein
MPGREESIPGPPQRLNPLGEPGDQGSCLERETGLEPATLALARRCSTTELLPHTS